MENNRQNDMKRPNNKAIISSLTEMGYDKIEFLPKEFLCDFFLPKT
jgi:hypothetical protein